MRLILSSIFEKMKHLAFSCDLKNMISSVDVKSEFVYND